MKAKKALFLIDAHAVCYRSFFAIKGLSDSKGRMTNAVLGFANTLRKIQRQFEPHYMAACFDSPVRTHRQEKFASYKIQRPGMPDGLISQIPVIKEVVRGYRVPVLERDGFEADDIIATLARHFASPDLNVIIVSDDKDMYQLVDQNVQIYSPRKDQLIGAVEVKEILGFGPEYVADFIGLAGDSVDNIPGVKGIGDVSARQLILQYGHLEDIYGHLEEIPSAAVKKRLQEQRAEAGLSKELAVLTDTVPVQFDLEDMRVTAPDVETLLALFTEYELKRLAAELRDQQPGAPERDAAPLRKAVFAADLDGMVAGFRQGGEFAFLFDRGRGEEIWGSGEIFLACPDGPVWQVPADKAKALEALWRDGALRKVTFDSKEALKELERLGCPVNGELFDVKLAAYLLSPARGAADISDLGWQYLKVLPSETMDGPRQVRLISQLAGPLADELKAHDLDKLFIDIELPLARVLCAMEREGVRIDTALLQTLSAECGRRIVQLHKDVFRIVGEEFNLNSPKQLAAVLFDKLKLPVLKRTKTGNSTNEDVLVRLAARHPIPALILEYRQLAKLKSTYIDALPKMIDPETGKVHATFNQSGAETGRLSSNNPNLQNIPIRTDLGREIRKAFIPSRPDGLIVSADYSQIELRILAHLSGDENLLAAFKQGQDIHTFTAAQIFDVPEKDVTRDMRHSAKRVNFGIIYGMSAFGLAKDLDVSQAEAAAFIDRYFLRYPRVKGFMDRQIEECEGKGYVTTLLNRRRYLPDILSGNISVRQFAQRQAINTPVQGTAADMIKLAMIRIFNEFNRQRLNSRMIITVHDELVFDVPAEEKDVLVPLVRQQMEHTLELKVPVTVTVKCGPNWLETNVVG